MSQSLIELRKKPHTSVSALKEFLSSVKAIAKGLGVPVSQLIKDKGAPLGPVAVEVGQLFESVPQKLQDAVVNLLRAVSDETAEPARGRPPRAAPRRSARG